jgi:aryl-alcohol dehydrogenase (NADP+)
MVDGEDAKRVLKRAWDLGINFFDTANVYSTGRSEEILGEFAKGLREDMVIATKVYNAMGQGPNQRGLSNKHIRWQIRQSLERLGTDYVDLYQVHRWDYGTPVGETLAALSGLVRDGRALYLGASSMWAWQFATALRASDCGGHARFSSMQNLYNLLYREEEREMNPLCMAEGVATIPWSPTAAGILSGKYFRDGRITTTKDDSSRVAPGSFSHARYVGRPSNDEIVRRLIEVATQKGARPAQVALGWLLYKGVTAPIVGTTKIDHLEDMVGSLDIKLSSGDVKYLEEPYVPQNVTGHV